MQCVTEAQVLGLLRNALGADERAAVEQHLDECAECLELVTLASKTSLAARDLQWSLASGSGGDAHHDVGALVPGTAVGRYEILSTIGRGGMGTVYAARDAQLDRRVAIKLVNPSLADNAHSQIALLREAQAMARITQPNVLTVYDMGTFEEAVFLAAELVDGETLELWMARRHPWRQIVGVFVQAARGLEAAHAAGLVHRDFKPTNVLVGADGRVRVFDFGVVRFTDTAVPGRELAGTPLYMSPEQLRGEVADARADQYAFCVALYEVLFGRRPPDALSPSSRTPSPPSANPVRVAASDRVPGWLREIVKRGLEPLPERRFPSMTAVIAALERGLRRRGRWLAAGIAGAAVSVAAATAAVGYTRGKQDSEERCPLISVGSAWSAPRKAQVTTAIAAVGLPQAPTTGARVERMLDRFAARWSSQRRDACLAFESPDAEDRALYDRRVMCLDQQRLVFDAIVERFAVADRTTVQQADRLLAALPDLDVCASPDATAWPANPIDRARFATHLQQVAQVTSLAEAGKYDEAARQIPALAAAAKELGSRRAEADALYLTGHVARLRGRFVDAAREVERALWSAEATRYDELVVTAACELLEIVGDQQHRPDDARRFVELARAAAERVGSVAARARAAHAIGNLEREAGHHDLAERELTEALQLLESRSPSDPVQIGSVMLDLARLDYRRGRYAAAEARARKAEELLARQLGELHPVRALALTDIANAYWRLKRFDEAAATYAKARAILEAALGPDHLDVAMAMNHEALVPFTRGDFGTARPLLERAIAILERIDPGHPQLALALSNLAELLRVQGDLAGAERLSTRALELRRARLGENHPATTGSYLNLAFIARARGDLRAMKQRCDEASRSAAGSDANDAGLRAGVETCQGAFALAIGRRAEAVTILERALAIGGRSEDAARLAHTQFELARALPDSARARAIELARTASAGYALDKAFRQQDRAKVDAWLRAVGAALPAPTPK